MLKLKKILLDNKIVFKSISKDKSLLCRLPETLNLKFDFTIEQLEEIQQFLKDKYKLDYTLEELMTIVED